MALSTEEQTPQTRHPLLNVPNQLTSLRLVLSIVLFVLIELGIRWQAPGYFLARCSCSLSRPALTGSMATGRAQIRPGHHARPHPRPLCR